MEVRRNAILTQLSPEQEEQFYARLTAMEGGPTLRNIIELAADYGIASSKHSASSLKPHFATYLQRIQRARETATFVEQHSRPEDAARVADAAGQEISQQLFEFMLTSKLDLSEKEGLEQAQAITTMVSKMRQADHRLRALENKLKEAEAKTAEAKTALTDSSLTDSQKAARMREVFGLVAALVLGSWFLVLGSSSNSNSSSSSNPRAYKALLHSDSKGLGHVVHASACLGDSRTRTSSRTRTTPLTPLTPMSTAFEKIRAQLQAQQDLTLSQDNEALAELLKTHPTGQNCNHWVNPFPKAHPFSLLFEYQARYVLDDSRFKIALQARQTGKDFSTQGEIVLDCLTGDKREWMVAAPSERQSMDSLDKAKDWARAFDLAIADYQEQRVGSSETLLKSAEITFSNGSKIRAVPGKPDTVRGRSASVMLTEFDFFEQPALTWRAILPSITNPLRGGEKQVRLVSTPNGKGSALHKLWVRDSSASMRWSRHQTSILRAALHGLPVDVAALQEAFGEDHDGYAQEMLCDWLDSSSVLLPYDLIANAESMEATEVWDGWGQPHTDPLYLGIDFGRQNDPTVCVTLQKVGDVFYTRELLLLRGMATDEQERLLSPRLAQCQRAALDYTGPGIGLGDYLVKAHGEYAPEQHKMGKLQLQTFTAPWKRLAYPRFRRAFEAPCKLRIPVSIDLREDLHAVSQVSTATGYSYQSPRTAKGHSDRTSAYVLAWGIATDSSHSPAYAESVAQGTRSREQGAWRMAEASPEDEPLSTRRNFSAGRRLV